MTDLKTNSPAYNRTRIDGDTSLIELPWCGKINLRGDSNNNQFVKKVESEIELALPVEANTCTKNDAATLYWLGPNEWLMHCQVADTENKISNLKTVLSGLHSAVVEVTDYYTVLRLDGPDSPALLAKACPLDLHPDRFANGACAQTRFGQASILLHKINHNINHNISAAPAYDIQVRWSFTEYVWDYLASGMNAL